jgi:hypothetical protein
MKKRHRELLDEYAACRRREAEVRGSNATESSEAATAIAEDLRRLWDADDGDPRELDKRLRQIDFREGVLGLYTGPPHPQDTREYEHARETQKALAGEFRDFWLASGHDMEELRRFESDVDAQVFSMIVK